MTLTKAQREQAALLHSCPRCKVQAHFRCVRYKGIRPIGLTHPHAERTALVEEKQE
jgi:hypothetical protein